MGRVTENKFTRQMHLILVAAPRILCHIPSSNEAPRNKTILRTNSFLTTGITLGGPDEDVPIVGSAIQRLIIFTVNTASHCVVVAKQSVTLGSSQQFIDLLKKIFRLLQLSQFNRQQS